MEAIDIFTSFIISLAAGNLPTIKDIMSKNDSIEKALKKCFRKAVDKWNVIEETKQDVRDNYEIFLSEIKEYINDEPKREHSKYDELLYLWAKEISNDHIASSFVIQVRQELELKTSQEIKDLVSSLCQNQEIVQKDIQKLLTFVDPFRGEGVKTIKEYWEYWATGKDFILHSDFVLAEREKKISEIVNSAAVPGVYTVGASSVSEAIAFVCASLLSSKNTYNNAIVITKESAYEKILATNPSGFIIITDLRENHNVAAHNGNVVFHCVLKNNEGLPELSPGAFASAIKKSLSKKVESYHLAKQGGYDVVSLRRILKIENNNPHWLTLQNIDAVVNMCMLGGWNENVNGDKEIIENFTSLKYDEFITRISPLLKADNAPIIKIGTEWKVKSPLDLFSLILDRISDRHIEKLLAQVTYLSMDADTEAIEKLEETEFRFHTNNQLISNSLKFGIYGGMSIMAEMMEYSDPQKAEIIKKAVADEFAKYDLAQYLSNRHNIIFLAAANPKSFLDFIFADIQNGGEILDALFKGRKKAISLNGYEINNAELMHVLECIALDKRFLYEVTYILLYATKYPKVGNYVDSVKDLLRRIYQFLYPQTEATFAERFDVLTQLKAFNPNGVFWVLCSMIDSITAPKMFHISQGFPMHIYRRRKDGEYPTEEDVYKVLSLIMDVFTPTAEHYLKCLNIAMCRRLGVCRNSLLDFLVKESVNFKKNVQVIDEIDKEIIHHESYPTSDWALSDEDLRPFKALYNTLCADDKLLQYRKFFRSELPIQTDYYNHRDFLECERKSAELRGLKIQDIENTFGINSIWEYAKTVENPKAIFEGLATLDNPEYAKAVYSAYVSDKIEKTDASEYFSRWYDRIGETVYMNLIDELNLLDNSRIALPLYAPSWSVNLAEKADRLGTDVNRQYWENVRIWQRPTDSQVESVFQHLLDSKREWDLILLMNDEEILKNVNLELKVRILKGAVFHPKKSNSHSFFYRYNKILLSIKDNELLGTNFEQDIFEIEGYLFPTLNDHLKPGEELHIVRALKWNVNLMIGLLKSYENLNSQDSIIGFEMLYKFVNEVNFIICQREDGTIDFKSALDYISTLVNCKELPLRYTLTGNLLHAIMACQGEPDEEYCALIESIANDNVDQHLYMAIRNSRECTCHECYEGGRQERSLADKYASLARKVLPYSYRLKKVFENLTASYLAEARHMDDDALRNKFCR